MKTTQAQIEQMRKLFKAKRAVRANEALIKQMSTSK